LLKRRRRGFKFRSDRIVYLKRASVVHLGIAVVLNRFARFVLVQTYQIGKKIITNYHKLDQTAINYSKWPQNTPYGHKIYQHLPFKGPPKFAHIWDFWFENKPSGNPGFEHIQKSLHCWCGTDT
jgi:hypothetical protein